MAKVTNAKIARVIRAHVETEILGRLSKQGWASLKMAKGLHLVSLDDGAEWIVGVSGRNAIVRVDISGEVRRRGGNEHYTATRLIDAKERNWSAPDSHTDAITELVGWFFRMFTRITKG